MYLNFLNGRLHGFCLGRLLFGTDRDHLGPPGPVDTPRPGSSYQTGGRTGLPAAGSGI